MRCTSCGSELGAGDRFCNTCGSAVAATCSQCGAALAPEATFCAACGARVGTAAPVQAGYQQTAATQPQQATYYPPQTPVGPPAEPYVTAPAAAPSGYDVSRLASGAAARTTADRRLYFLTDGLLLPIVTLGIWSIVLVYRLIKRRDEHLKRELEMDRGLLQAIWQRAQARGYDPLSLPEATVLSAAIQQREAAEQPKGAALWLILGFLTFGLAWIYVYYFLTVDFYHHEQRQLDIMDKANAVLARIGAPTLVPPPAVLPERRFWLNWLASICTGGIWGIVWFYHWLSDPNQHFEAQWSWEDGFVQQVGAWW